MNKKSDLKSRTSYDTVFIQHDLSYADHIMSNTFKFILDVLHNYDLSLRGSKVVKSLSANNNGTNNVSSFGRKSPASNTGYSSQSNNNSNSRRRGGTTCVYLSIQNNNFSRSYKKFDFSKIPNDFMQSDFVLSKVFEKVDQIVQDLRSQSNIDKAYESWCTLLKENMDDVIPHKVISTGCKGLLV
ncbi:hypothetical protein ACF0H5_010115 [Mactra antiquata]